MRWSPDGTKILFASQDHNLYLVHPDGSASTKDNLRTGHAKGPAWSPDGRWIIFSFSLDLPQSGGVPTCTGPGRTARI